MSVKFSVIMTLFDTCHFLPRALMGLLRQEHEAWELLIAQDGPLTDEQTRAFSPRRVLEEVADLAGEHRLELFVLPRAEGCVGNVGRRRLLKQAVGDYVCWVNHDNLIAPRYLAAHAENVVAEPGCLSLVRIDYWKGGRFRGTLPPAKGPLSYGNVDLLNFALPLTTARELAFPSTHDRRYDADWHTFSSAQRALKTRQHPHIVGVHF